MTTFNDNESGASVRAKINAAITTVDGLGTGDNLLMTAAERTKLGGVEAGATADQTAAQIKAKYESNTNTNAFTDAEKSKLANTVEATDPNKDAFWGWDDTVGAMRFWGIGAGLSLSAGVIKADLVSDATGVTGGSAINNLVFVNSQANYDLNTADANTIYFVA